jgi:hypothetical protein
LSRFPAAIAPSVCWNAIAFCGYARSAYRSASPALGNSSLSETLFAKTPSCLISPSRSAPGDSLGAGATELGPSPAISAAATMGTSTTSAIAEAATHVLRIFLSPLLEARSGRARRSGSDGSTLSASRCTISALRLRPDRAVSSASFSRSSSGMRSRNL